MTFNAEQMMSIPKNTFKIRTTSSIFNFDKLSNEQQHEMVKMINLIAELNTGVRVQNKLTDHLKKGNLNLQTFVNKNKKSR